MCGRYAFALSNEEIYDGLENQLPRMFERGRPRWEREQDFRPGNYNVAPRQRMPIIHRDQEHQDRAMLHTAQWGLIPHWTKHPPTTPLNTINARSESLLEAGSGGMWHALKGYKRCIIPAQGYYEWQKKPSSKVAHFTRLPSPTPSRSSIPIMFFAGLYDTVKYASPVESHFKPTDESDTREPYPTGNPLPLTTYTILTTSPPKEFMWLHDRMPCILSEWGEVERWLDLGEVKGWEEGKGGTGEVLKGRSGLESYPVPPEVGKVGTNSPTFIQPVSERADGIKSFFQKQSPAKPKSSAKGVTDAVKQEGDEKGVKTEDGDVKPSLAGASVSESKDSIKKDVKAEGLGDDSNAPNQGEGREDDLHSPSKTKRKVMMETDSADPSHGEDAKESETQLAGGKRARSESSGHTSGVKAEEAKRDVVSTDGGEAPEVQGVQAVEIESDSESEKKKRLKGKSRAGHQTAVTRRKDDDGKNEQQSITNFFGSPAKKEAPSAGRAMRSTAPKSKATGGRKT